MEEKDRQIRLLETRLETLNALYEQSAQKMAFLDQVEFFRNLEEMKLAGMTREEREQYLDAMNS
jgi:hypothetical protein